MEENLKLFGSYGVRFFCVCLYVYVCACMSVCVKSLGSWCRKEDSPPTFQEQRLGGGV